VEQEGQVYIVPHRPVILSRLSQEGRWPQAATTCSQRQILERATAEQIKPQPFSATGSWFFQS
jgi:hypothetical protein